MSGFVSRWVVASVRVRPTGGTRDVAVNVSCEVTLENRAGNAVELGAEIRDELIALEHAASRFN
jgi:hypothetical protein